MKRTIIAIIIVSGMWASTRAVAQTTGVPGNPVPCCGTQMLGTDGTNSRGVKTNSNGVLQVGVDPNTTSNVSIQQNVIGSALNSSTAQLNAGATFTGGCESTLSANALQVNVRTDQQITIEVDQFPDAACMALTSAFTYVVPASSTSSPFTNFTTQATNSFYKIKATNNGGITTTTFRVDTAICPICSYGFASGATSGVSANGSAALGNPVWICGLNGSNCKAIAVDASGNIILSNLPATVTTNSGAADASTLRVITATNSPVQLASGANIAGKIGIDQTTPGTTNAVSATNLPTTVDTNSGTTSASTLRVVVATNVALPLGASTVGQSVANGSSAPNDTAGVARPLATVPMGWDSAANQQMRTASLGNEAPSSGAFTPLSGLQMVEKGPRWTINNVSAGGAQGTASIASAAAKRHVIDCLSFSANSSAAIVAANTTVNIRDGASGAGTVIWSYSVSFPTAAALGLQEVPSFGLCGLNLIGTTNTAMTIEFAAAVTGAIQNVNASGYDIN